MSSSARGQHQPRCGEITLIQTCLEESESHILGGSPLSLKPVTKGGLLRDYEEADVILRLAEKALTGLSSKADSFSAVSGDKSLTFDFQVMARDASLLRCQIAGSRANFSKLLFSADRSLECIETINSMSEELDLKKCQDETTKARALGYKGFAMAKMGQHREALPILERSAALFEAAGGQGGQRTSAAAPGRTLAEKRQRREHSAVMETLGACYRAGGVAPPLPRLLKYPRTAHLFDAGGSSTTEDDVVLSMDDAMLWMLCDGRSRVIVEEKVDGANLGFSLCPMNGKVLVQNRSHYISTGDHKQFSQITPWVEEHRTDLVRILSGGDAPRPNNLVLYGEWVAARHSIPYDRLPGYFIAFDLFDQRREKFFSRRRFHQALRGSGIPVVPTIVRGRTFGPYRIDRRDALSDVRKDLLPLLETPSAFRSDGGTVEGVVLRMDDDDGNDEGDECGTDAAGGGAAAAEGPAGSRRRGPENGGGSGRWLAHRCKVVRPDFVRGCAGGHWSSRPVEKQRVDREFAASYLADCCAFAAAAAAAPAAAAAAAAPPAAADSSSSSPHGEAKADEGAATEQRAEEEEEADGDSGDSSSSDGRSGHSSANEVSEEGDGKPPAPKGPAERREAACLSRLRKEREARLSRARRRAPRCVVLCGLPGSGKSTFSERLCSGFRSDEGKGKGGGGGGGGVGGYTVINQDRMGRKECVAAAGRASRGRGRVVVDRCNPTESERYEWAGILHSPPRGEIALVHFATDVETCVERVWNRVNHETIPLGRGERIVRDVAMLFEEPTEEERQNIYGGVHVVRSPEDSRELLRCWGVETSETS